MPHAVWLLPGIGPQGGSGRDLAPAFAPGPAGGLVSASRAIVYAFERGGSGGDPAACARDEAARLRELIWGLYARGTAGARGDAAGRRRGHAV